MSYGTPFAPLPWPTLRLDPSDWLQACENNFQWSVTDEGLGGNVHFLTTVSITVTTPADVTDAALCRMACFYIVGRLHGKALADACQSLADIYAWQLDQMHSVSQVPEPKRHRAARVRQVERVPFNFDEE